MNSGAAAFLIFLLIVGAFTGIGYLIPEMNHRAAQIQKLNEETIRLQAELEKARQMILMNASELEKTQERNAELEYALETERQAKEAVIKDFQQLQETYGLIQSQLAGLQAENQELRQAKQANGVGPQFSLNRSNGNKSWPWLSPILIICLASGYGLRRVKTSKGRQYPTSRENLGTPASYKPENRSDFSSQNVKVLVPREKIPEFITWLRQQ